MKKKLITFFALLALLLMALPVYAAAASIDIRVTPSASQIDVGETVEYVVTATGEDVVAMQFELRFPEGMSYVPNTGAVPNGLAQKLGVPAADWTELTHMFTFYNDVGITIKQGTELLRFTCKAEKAGTYGITLYELLPFDSNFEEFAPEVTVEPVNVRASQGQTEPPATLPAATEPVPTLPAATEPQVTAPDVTVPTAQPVVTEPAIGTDPTVEAATVPQEQPAEGDATDATIIVQEPTEPEMTQQPTDQQGSLEATEEPTTEQEPTEEKKPSAVPWIILAAVIAAGISAAAFLVIRKKKQA